MSTLSALSDRTHYLIVTASEVYDADLGIETVKFQVCALPYDSEEIVWDSNEETGEQNYADEYKQAKEMSEYYNRGLRVRRYMEDYLGLLSNSKEDLFNSGAVTRTVEGNDVKYRLNKALIANNVKQEMIRNGYGTEDFQLAMAVRVIRENMPRLFDLI